MYQACTQTILKTQWGCLVGKQKKGHLRPNLISKGRILRKKEILSSYPTLKMGNATTRLYF